MHHMPGSPPLRIVDTQNRGGSAQHFYHFFFGCLFPLARYLAETGTQDEPLLVRSCGPLDAILLELDLPGLMLAGKAAFQNLRDTLPPAVARKVGLIGYDIGWPTHTYDREALTLARAWLLERLAPHIASHRDRIAADWPNTPRVLIIDRGMPDPFYRSHLSERPDRGVGAERRRVSNHDAVVAASTHLWPGTRSVLLEGRTLAEQIALFQLADVVAAQHGAALAHMVWLKPGAGVIEFTGGEPMHIAFFRKLATTFAIPHIAFPQDGQFGAIDTALFGHALTAMFAGRITPPPAGAAAARAPASEWQTGMWPRWGGAPER
jgi:hypothetical protein